MVTNVQQKNTIYLYFPFVFSLLFYSNQFIDSTTYPKLISLTLGLVALTFFILSTKRNEKKLLMLLLPLVLYFFVSYSTFGSSSISGTLLGFPQRNLGLLSLWAAVVSAWVFQTFGIMGLVHTLRIVGSILSICIIASHLPGTFFLFDQFVYPNPGALNSNVVSPILAFVFLANITREKNEFAQKRYLRVIISHYFQIATVLIATYLLGNLQSFVYLLYIFVSVMFLKFAGGAAKIILVGLPFLFSLVYVIFTTVFDDFLFDVGDSSTIERLTFLKLFWPEVAKTPLRFRAIDTSADLNLMDQYIPGYNAMIDNAHNVFLEIGVHTGLYGLFLFLLACFVLMSRSVFKVFLYSSKTNRASLSPEQFIIVSQQLAFISFFFAILHPNSIWIYGAVAGVSLLLFPMKKPIVLLRGKSMMTRWNFLGDKTSSKSVSKVMSSTERWMIILVLFSVTFFCVLDATRKIQFRLFERQLTSAKIDYEVGVSTLTRISLELNDRDYLDYAGRKLLEAGRCQEATQVYGRQVQLRFEDLNQRLLGQALIANCFSAEPWNGYPGAQTR